MAIADSWLHRAKHDIGTQRVDRAQARAAAVKKPVDQTKTPHAQRMARAMSRAMADSARWGFHAGIAAGLTDRVGDEPLGRRLKKGFGRVCRIGDARAAGDVLKFGR